MNKFIKYIRGLTYSFRLDLTQFVKRILFYLRIIPSPFRISLDVTDACNFKCPSCDKWKTTQTNNELSLSDWEVIFNKIKNTSILKEIAISGGEPFLHPHIFDIIKMAKKMKLHIVVLSNGSLLTESHLFNLNKIGLDQLMLSLNSLSTSTHDQSRGKKGNCKHILALIESWKQLQCSMRLSLSTVIMEANVNELVSMAQFAHQKNLTGIMFQALLPSETHFAFSSGKQGIEIDESWYKKNPFWVRDITVLKGEIHQLLSLQKKGLAIHNPAIQLKQFIDYFENPDKLRQKPCLGTQNRLFIDPTGNIRLCYGYPAIGNILTDNPNKVWRSAAAKQIRKASRKCDRPC